MSVRYISIINWFAGADILMLWEMFKILNKQICQTQEIHLQQHLNKLT